MNIGNVEEADGVSPSSRNLLCCLESKNFSWEKCSPEGQMEQQRLCGAHEPPVLSRCGTLCAPTHCLSGCSAFHPTDKFLGRIKDLLLLPTHHAWPQPSLLPCCTHCCVPALSQLAASMSCTACTRALSCDVTPCWENACSGGAATEAVSTDISMSASLQPALQQRCAGIAPSCAHVALCFALLPHLPHLQSSLCHRSSR